MTPMKTAVLARQLEGWVYQPPLGDQTCLGYLQFGIEVRGGGQSRLRRAFRGCCLLNFRTATLEKMLALQSGASVGSKTYHLGCFVMNGVLLGSIDRSIVVLRDSCELRIDVVSRFDRQAGGLEWIIVFPSVVNCGGQQVRYFQAVRVGGWCRYRRAVWGGSYSGWEVGAPLQQLIKVQLARRCYCRNPIGANRKEWHGSSNQRIPEASHTTPASRNFFLARQSDSKNTTDQLQLSVASHNPPGNNFRRWERETGEGPLCPVIQ